VHVAPFDFLSPALSSRYIAAIHWVPYYLGDGREWLDTVVGLASAHRYDLIIPCDERALLPLHRHRAAIEPFSRLALPDDRGIEVFYDKQQTRDLARAVGVAIAPGRVIETADVAADLVAEVGLPLVIKPRRSYALEDLYTRGRVRVILSATELAEVLPLVRDGRYFFEGFFPGQGVGVSILSRDGRILQAFQHHRVHERGGSGYFRVSAPLSPPLMEAVSAIIAATAYTGVAMFEFKVNRDDGDWILLEVNARPWGSMPLPVGLGVDFPYDWYRLLVDDVETPRHSYRLGVHARNFVPDFLAMMAEARENLNRPWRIGALLARRLWEGRYVLTGREFQDVFTSDDRAPAVAEIRQLVCDFGGRLASIVPGDATRRGRHDRWQARSARAGEREGHFAVIFVCQGNICRSPFAEHAFRSLVAAVGSSAGTSKIRCSSAGMLPREGRCSPSAALDAARSRGIDLSSHRSRHLSQESVAAADLIVVFDSKNLHWLRQRFPEAADKTVFLGSFLPSGERSEIADPDGGTRAVFEASYECIASAVDGLAKTLTGETGR
jgi:protein-tyrosine-phosphatase/predicted ATP-grasp superfamily ATP-dependent carboligase